MLGRDPRTRRSRSDWAALPVARGGDVFVAGSNLACAVLRRPLIGPSRPPSAASSPRPRPVGRRVAAAPACARRRPPRRRRRRPSAAGACAWRRGWGAWGARARVRRAVRGRPCVSATPPPRPQRQRGRAARLNRNPLRHVVAPRRSQRARRGRPERRHAAPGLAASATSMAAPAGPVPALVTSAAAPAASPAVAAA